MLSFNTPFLAHKNYSLAYNQSKFMIDMSYDDFNLFNHLNRFSFSTASPPSKFV